MEVVASEPAGDIDGFTDEIESVYFLDFHTLAREFTCVEAAESDFCCTVTFGS